MKLNTIKHDLKSTLWCGPAALAAVTGKPTSEIVAVAKRISGQRAIRGMSNHLLKKTAAAFGVHLSSNQQDLYNQVQDCHLPTLARWARENKSLFKDRPVIVNVTGHYVTLKGNTFVDNNVTKPVRLKDAPFRRSRVRAVFIPSEVPTAAQAILTQRAIDKVCVRVEDSERTTAKRLARKLGIEIEMDDCAEPGVFLQPRFVYAPAVLDSPELDPHDGDHAVNDWKEALERVRTYAKLATVIPCLAEQ